MPESARSWTSRVLKIMISAMTERTMVVVNRRTAIFAEREVDESAEFKNGSGERGFVNVGAGDLARDEAHGIFERGAFEIGAFEIGTDEAGFAEIGTDEAGVAKIGEEQVGGAEIDVLQVGVAEIDADQFGAFVAAFAQVGTGAGGAVRIEPLAVSGESFFERPFAGIDAGLEDVGVRCDVGESGNGLSLRVDEFALGLERHNIVIVLVNLVFVQR